MFKNHCDAPHDAYNYKFTAYNFLYIPGYNTPTWGFLVFLKTVLADTKLS